MDLAEAIKLLPKDKCKVCHRELCVLNLRIYSERDPTLMCARCADKKSTKEHNTFFRVRGRNENN